MRAACGGLALLLPALVATPCAAHELRPGYLALREIGAGRFEASFRVPRREDRVLALRALLPRECSDVGPRARVATAGALTERWTVRCEGGLVGREIRVGGLEATLTDVLVRIERADGTAQVARLLPGAPSLRVVAAPTGAEVARAYLALGVEHITGGVDHLLFVLALLLLVRGARRLVATVTAFTLAHSLTLAAATLGWLWVAGPPVEATIALSIAFVAREIARGERASEGLTARRPWLVAFAFGLLHGLGFAGALRDVGLPEHAIPAALLGFNLGVEAGQLLFVAGVLALAALARRVLPPPARPVRLASAYAIGALAMFWMIERVAAFAG